MLLAYGIAWPGTPLPDRLGILDHPLAWVVGEELAVLVEPGFDGLLLESWQEPQWVAAALTHAAVVRSVFATATILPIALRSGFFAAVTPIYTFLQAQGPYLTERLRYLDGCGEVTVRVWAASPPVERLSGRAYFAARRSRVQGLAAVQEVLMAYSREYRVGLVQGDEVLCWDLLVTAAQREALLEKTAALPGWRVDVGEWLPPYGFV